MDRLEAGRCRRIHPQLRPAFDVRETRDRERFRENLIHSRMQIRNEIQKGLASAGVPIKACINDLFGVSGMSILTHLAVGETAWDCLPGLLRG